MNNSKMIMKKKKNNFGLLFAFGFGCLIFGIGLSLYFLYVMTTYGYQQDKSIFTYILNQIKNNFGDFLSGTIGLLFTLTTTLFLFVTFKEQRKQFDDTNKNSEQSRFETTFFNLLSMLDDVRNNVNQNIKINFVSSKSSTIYDYYACLKRYYDDYPKTSKKTEFHTLMKNLNNKSLPSQMEIAEGSLQDFYDSFMKENKCNIGYYFRYIYNTINFAINERKDYEDQTKYLNILIAQLSNEELALIFYDALSTYGKNKHGEKKFKEILNQYQIFENIDESYLLERSHYLLYPNTKFKFLNRDELGKQISKKPTY